MSNYIILENRAELTTAQVLGGMNFSAIVAGAASATSDTFGGKTFGISNGFLAVLIVVGGIALYKNYSSNEDGSLSEVELYPEENILIRNSSKGPQLMVETIPPKNNRISNITPNAACQPGGHERGDNISNHMTYKVPEITPLNVDSLNALAEMRSTAVLTTTNVPNHMVGTPQQLSCRKEGEPAGNQMTEEPKIYNTTVVSPNATSYLWQPPSFNHYVEAATGQFKMDCNGCDFNYISGSQLDNKNYKGVWMRVTRNKKIKFKLESGLKNISLIRTEGSKTIVMHPVAVGIDGPQWREKEWTYLSNKFKAIGATYTFGDHIDFYLVFENAKVGDRLVIDDFVETVVVEK